MPIKTLLTFLLTILLFHSCKKEVCSIDHDSFIVEGALGTSIDNMILAEEEIRFSGSVLVADGGTEVLRKSYQYEKRNKECEIDPNTSYWVGSVSKQFCAAAILLLEEQGEIEFSDSIGSLLPGVPADKYGISLHQLLTHTSGLADDYLADGIGDRNAAISALLGEELLSSPGERYTYSNQGYQLLAIVVEEVTGKSYEAYMNEYFIQPLAMSQTGFSGDGQAWNKLAVAEKGKGASRKIEGNPQSWEVNYGYKGSTGLLTTTEDLFKWHTSLLDNTILSANSTDLMFTRHVLKGDEIYYGYGWNLFDSDNGEVIVHSGDDDFIGQSGSIRYYKDLDRLIVVLSNGGYQKDRSVARAMAAGIVELVF